MLLAIFGILCVGFKMLHLYLEGMYSRQMISAHPHHRDLLLCLHQAALKGIHIYVDIAQLQIDVIHLFSHCSVTGINRLHQSLVVC